jgi:hypothetical protein
MYWPIRLKLGCGGVGAAPPAAFSSAIVKFLAIKGRARD